MVGDDVNERDALRQVLEEKCPDAIRILKDDDISKLAAEGYITTAAFVRATEARLVGVLPGRSGLVGLLLEAFAGMFPSQGFPVMMLIFGAVTMGG